MLNVSMNDKLLDEFKYYKHILDHLLLGYEKMLEKEKNIDTIRKKAKVSNDIIRKNTTLLGMKLSVILDNYKEE